MKLGVFSVRDVAVSAFLPPFFARSKGEAIRSFTDAINDPKSHMGNHVSDFILYQLGVFDDDNGSIVAYDAPEKLLLGVEVVREVAP